MSTNTITLLFLLSFFCVSSFSQQTHRRKLEGQVIQSRRLYDQQKSVWLSPNVKLSSEGLPLRSLNKLSSTESQNYPKRNLKKTKKLLKCPKGNNSFFLDWNGKDPKKPCTKKCKPKWKTKDYLQAFNKCRTDPVGCSKMCEKITLKPLIKKFKFKAANMKKLKFKGKPYKNCRLGNQVFFEGRKGATKLSSFLKAQKGKKLKKLNLDPCQTYSETKHAEYMGKSLCLTHNQFTAGNKPAPKKEKCDGKGKKKILGCEI